MYPVGQSARLLETIRVHRYSTMCEPAHQSQVSDHIISTLEKLIELIDATEQGAIEESAHLGN